MTLKTLLLLRQVLQGQQLQIGAPDFVETAQSVLDALKELDAEIAKASE